MSRRWGGALILPVIGLPLVAAPASGASAPPALAPTVATPPAPPSRSLPTALDVFVPYQGQTVCDPRPEMEDDALPPNVPRVRLSNARRTRPETTQWAVRIGLVPR